MLEKIAYDKYKKSKRGRLEKMQEKILPKRPTAPYTHFQIEERKRNPEHYKKLSLESSAKEIALKWKSMDKDGKAKYMKAFSAQKKTYDKAKKNLKIKLIQGVKLKCVKNKVHQPFVAFIKAKYNIVKATGARLEHKDIMRILSQKWKALTVDEKHSYRLTLLLPSSEAPQ
jgi:HMG (high mobility group) box